MTRRGTERLEHTGRRWNRVVSVGSNFADMRNRMVWLGLFFAAVFGASAPLLSQAPTGERGRAVEKKKLKAD